MSKEGSIRIVAFSTIISRLTGLLRDMFVYAVFGTSALNSAFIIAFTIPNLFRRFMGEGALTSALVPVLAHTQAKDGQAAGYSLLNKVLSRSVVALLVAVILGTLAYQLIYAVPHLEERWYTSALLGRWVFPFLFFVCLSAIIGAALNLQKKFASTALAQIWVNLSMTLALAIAVLFISDDPLVRMLWLCGGVLVGGLLQMLLPGHALTLEGWKPQWDMSKDEKLGEVNKLLIPGLIGATVAQTNSVISQFLAFGLNDSAVSVLFLANRLMQLPLGVFAIAVTTVTFPLIAHKAAEGDKAGFRAAYNDGAMLIHAVMWPAGVGLAMLSEPLLEALFKWGSFDAQAVAQTWPILATYAMALPFYASATFVTRGLHSLKDTRTPVRWGVVALVGNLVLSLPLKGPMGTMGLVLANITSTTVLALGLRWELSRKEEEKITLSKGLANIILSAGIMAAVVLCAITPLPHSKLFSWLKIAGGASLGVVVYIVALWKLEPEIFGKLKSLALGKLGGKKQPASEQTGDSLPPVSE